jgi:YD repeat-containing protein
MTRALIAAARATVRDSLGRRTHRTTPTGATSAYSYDAVGNPVALTASGHTISFSYDAAGRIGRSLTGQPVGVRFRDESTEQLHWLAASLDDGIGTMAALMLGTRFLASVDREGGRRSTTPGRNPVDWTIPARAGTTTFSSDCCPGEPARRLPYRCPHGAQATRTAAPWDFAVAVAVGFASRPPRCWRRGTRVASSPDVAMSGPLAGLLILRDGAG